MELKYLPSKLIQLCGNTELNDFMNKFRFKFRNLIVNFINITRKLYSLIFQQEKNLISKINIL